MKRVGTASIAFASLFLSVVQVFGHGLSLEAHETGTGDGTVTRWYVDSDYYARDFNRQKRILVTVRDLSKQVSAVTIQVYFIGHPMGSSEPLFVYGHASVPVEFRGNLEVKGTVDAPSIRASVHRFGGVEYSSGADIDGWIVIGEYEGQAFQVRASRQRLLDLAEKDRASLDAMAADYDGHKRRR
jgi:hypothetical protein